MEWRLAGNSDRFRCASNHSVAAFDETVTSLSIEGGDGEEDGLTAG